jgi:hypothetical protein
MTNRRLRVGLAVVAGAIAVAVAAPTAAEAASTHQGSAQGSAAKKKTTSNTQAKHKNAPARSGPGAQSPGAAQPAKPKKPQRKDAPPDRGPHKATPNRTSQAGQSSPGRGSGPKAKVGVDRPDDRGPNKVTPQRRKSAADRDRRDRDKPRVASQGRPDLGRVAAGSAFQQLEAWTPKKPERKPGFHDLANRYRIGDQPRSPLRPLDMDGVDNDGNGLVDDEDSFKEFYPVNPVPTFGGGGFPPGAFGGGGARGPLRAIQDWWRGITGNVANGPRLQAQLAGQQISRGHAYPKHVVEQGQFPGVRTRDEFAKVVENVMINGAQRQLSGGRTAYWHEGVVVIRNPNTADGGTAFVPKDGVKYFEGLK